jgi:hypothetical protein
MSEARRARAPHRERELTVEMAYGICHQPDQRIQNCRVALCTSFGENYRN